MKEEIVALSGNVVNWTLTINQTKEMFEIIQVIAAIIVSILTALYIIWKWYKNAKNPNSDGGANITAKEAKELFEDLKEIGGKKDDQD